MKTKKEYIAAGVAFVLSAALCATGLWSRADRSLYDTALRAKSRIAPLESSASIIPVDLTDAAEFSLGTNVENRQCFLDTFTLMNKMNVAGGFDLTFLASKDKTIDSEIGHEAKKATHAVLAVVPLSQEETNYSGIAMSDSETAIIRKQLWHPVVKNEGKIPVAVRFQLPPGTISEPASHLAHVEIVPDDDGIYRKIPLFYKFEDGYMPSFALELAALQLGIDTSKVVVNAGHSLILPLADGTSLSVPIDNRGCMYIPYACRWNEGTNHIPLDTFVSALTNSDVYNQLYDIVEGNTLLISDITTSHKDFGTTPLESVYPLSGVHSTILSSFLTGTFLRPLPLWTKCLMLLLIGLLLCFAVTRKKDAPFHIICAATALAFSITTAALWFFANIVPWFAGPLFVILFTWLITLFVRLLAEYKERLLLGNALSRYFPRALAQRILKEGKTDLKPAEKSLTIFFSDISGFTKWSSDKQPEVVHAFLSDYLETIASIIFAHGGTVDKFIGDGTMAFFGDPFDQPDQTERCVSAAIDIQKEVRKLAAKWKPIVDIDLHIRIGINYGKVIAGNLGSKTRIDYTLIGAAVNLASRMESNAPVGGILVAHDAWERVKDEFPFGTKQEITAKGYADPVEAYAIDIDFDKAYLEEAKK
jgi:adenylate cyclase